LRHRLDRQPPRARLRRIAADARQTRVHHVADARNRERGFRDVRRENQFPPLRRGKHALLLAVGESPEERDDLCVRQPAPFQQFRGFANVPLGGQKHEDVARIAFTHDALHRLDCAVDIVERLGFGGAFIALSRIAAELVERRVNHFDRISAPRNLDDRRIIEGFGKRLGVDRRRGDDDFELGPLVTKVAQMTEEKVDVERTLVRLVQDDRVVVTKHRVALHLGEQHAVGHELDDRVARRAVVETDFAANRPTPLDVEFLRHAFRNRQRRHAPRLSAGDRPALASPRRETHLGNLRGFPRTRFAREDDHLAGRDQIHDLPGATADGQVRRKIDAEGRRGAVVRAGHREKRRHRGSELPDSRGVFYNNLS